MRAGEARTGRSREGGVCKSGGGVTRRGRHCSAEGVGRTLDPKWGGSAKMATAEEEPKPKKLKVEAPRALR